MDTQIILVLAATAFVFLLLVFLVNFILSYQRRNIAFNREKELMQSRFEQTLLKSQIEVQEATFADLAKELHDNVGQLLSSSKMLLGVTRIQMPDAPEALHTAEQTIGKAINELRALSKSMDKEWLEQFDLIENLTTEINRINSGLVLKTHFLHPEKLLLNAEKQIILFRIIQEALQNAIKHAQAKNIHVRLKAQDENLIVNVEDDGKGFNKKTNDGMGMRNMKHRTKLLGGSIEWNASEKGSSVSIVLPYKENMQ